MDEELQPTEPVNDGPEMQAAAVETLVRDLNTAVKKIEYLETHLTSCMDQFKYMSERFHDNIKHIRKVETRLENQELVLTNLEGRIESIAPARRHCLNPTCRRLMGERDAKCGHCGEKQLGGS